jgi:uncharacterized membrane protein YbaN (DUF454 family)
MQTETGPFENMSTKLIACVVIVALLLLGAAGLILPLIPGLLFLTLAAVVAAKMSPSFERTLRQSPTLSGYLDRTAGFMDLSPGDKVRVAVLLCVKMMIDGVAWLVAGVSKLVKAAERL